MSREWDPDPDTPHIEVCIKKTGRMVGLKAGDASGPHEYPFVQMIGVGTPVDLCQELDIGDRIKSINGVFLKGKKRGEIHKLVREIPIDNNILIKVVKSFKDKKFITDMGNAGFRVASVRRTNPLLAMAQEEDHEDDAIGEEEEPIAPIQADIIGEDAEEEENTQSNLSGGFDGFGDDEPDGFEVAEVATGDASDGGFKPSTRGFARKASVYGGFESSAGSGDAGESGTGVNTVSVNGEDFGFGEMSLDDDGWG